MGTIVALGLGSNVRHGRHGRPPQVLAAAVDALGLPVLARSTVVRTPPLGGRGARFANMAVLVRWDGPLPALLAHVKAVERRFGRRPGVRWGPRVLDIDLLAAEVQHRSRTLTVPHPGLPARTFALGPMADIWPGWRHPLSHATARQMHARLRKPRPSQG